MQNSRTDDIEHKILDSAGEVFAEHGFQGATVRDICARAGTNIASINYYFGDKAALYAEVLQYSHNCAQELLPALPENSAALSTEEKLYHFVFNFLRRLIEKGKPTWHGRLISREMMQPSPAFDSLIESGIKPHFVILLEIMGNLLRRTISDDAVGLCAASVIGQCHHFHHCRYVIEKLAPEHALNDENLAKIAKHITSFTLAATSSLARNQ